MTRRLILLLGLAGLVHAPAWAQPACPANFQGQSGPLTCQCPAGSVGGGTVWGTDIYTDDSQVCRAAVHAGAIGAGGGLVTVTPAPGRNSYQGSSRNGVPSQNYGAWGASFTVAAGTGGGKGGGGNVVAGPPACPGNFEGQSGPLSCSCGSGAMGGGTVWGTGVYTSDSALCRAAQHLGVIGAGGGVVNVMPLPGLPGYVGSTLNGVQTQNYGNWSRSFTFHR